MGIRTMPPIICPINSTLRFSQIYEAPPRPKTLASLDWRETFISSPPSLRATSWKKGNSRVPLRPTTCQRTLSGKKRERFVRAETIQTIAILSHNDGDWRTARLQEVVAFHLRKGRHKMRISSYWTPLDVCSLQSAVSTCRDHSSFESEREGGEITVPFSV